MESDQARREDTDMPQTFKARVRFTQMGYATNSTRSNGQKATNNGRPLPTMQGALQQLGPQKLNDPNRCPVGSSVWAQVFTAVLDSQPWKVIEKV